VCARCDEHRLANPARYCSSECQRQDWPQHKRRHREQSSILSNRVGVGEDSMAQHEQAVAGLQAQVAEELRADGGTAAVLVAKAAQRMAEQDFRGASARLRKAIQLEPDETANYVNLAVCYAHSNDGQSASDTYLKALARARPDTEEWAVIVARTFNTLSQPYCAKVAKPTWWNDAELKTLSARVLAAVDVLPAMNTYGQLDFTSPLCFAIKMRAYVCSWLRMARRDSFTRGAPGGGEPLQTRSRSHSRARGQGSVSAQCDKPDQASGWPAVCHEEDHHDAPGIRCMRGTLFSSVPVRDS
jgi:tetratricopeptide (TPR) repeat protein